MTKLIKRQDSESTDASLEVGLPEAGPTRRAPVIERETYDARNEAQQIRERAKAQAEQIVADAETEAESILAQAQEQAERIKQEAHQQGYDAGRQEGVTELTEVVANASARFQHVEAQIVPQLRELAVSIARKILGKELEFHPEAIMNIVKQALSEKARQRKEIGLRVHPEDLALIREHKSELLEVLSRAKEIAIREDANVSRHGVVIETDAGIIDAQLDSQLAIFEKALRDVHP